MTYIVGEISQRDAKTLYPNNGPWSGNNALGLELPFSPDANNRQSILTLPEWGFPEQWTVSLGLRTDGTINAQGARIVGEINFGAGGIVQSLEVDWIQGAQFSMPMNALTVVAQYDSVPGFVPPSGINLSVLLSKGVCPQRPTRTRSYLNIGPGAVSAPQLIPRFARFVTILPAQVNQAQIDAVFAATSLYHFCIDDAGTVVVGNGSFNGSAIPAFNNRIPVPRNARSLVGDNTGGATGLFFLAIYEM